VNEKVVLEIEKLASKTGKVVLKINSLFSLNFVFHHH